MKHLTKWDIAIAVASSGIAVLLINNSRIAHIQFKIPLKINEFVICNISHNSQLVHLIDIANLFILVVLLINSGGIAHFQFKIPLKIDEFSTYNISHNSQLAHLINIAKLFIRDEAPMIHKFAFEAIDQTFMISYKKYLIYWKPKARRFAYFLLKISDSTYAINPGTEDIITFPLNIAIIKGNFTDIIEYKH
ncbi:ATP-dependent DNA helicase Pif1-like [Rhizophagus clarus]|uniref:ATP-dependent DNA helicase n=1 Tax=Rhizophagus clarus TaxID=94130 RepID=A0A8H3ME78_9GLOM|nr:ATP-dependent DNA helicase Pif1-like [Rhizophagus clarus]